MAKITKFLWVCVLVLAVSVRVSAQLSGTYNVPTNYSTLASAISALNSQGISGPVIIELNAGYTETAPAGGFALTATGTSVNSITFRKTGAGSNPLITAFTGGAGTPASATQDGIWRFIGSDYVTIDGIDLVDNNTTNPSTMEFGYGFFKASVTDGCQNNTVKNCVISLSIVNNATGSGPAADGSRGINMVNSLYASQTTAMTPSSASGANSNNKFYTNTIQNCNVGIAVIGYAATSPFAAADINNDIGGTSNLTGNLIQNFGGATSATNPAAGVRTLAQYNLNVSYNTFNNNTGSGSNHVSTLRGIYTNLATSANVSISNNTITLKSAGTTAQVAAIENSSGATAANNTVSITNNLITGCSNTLNTSGSFYGIYNNAASAAYLDVSGNRLTGINSLGTTGTNYLIYNTGAVANSISLNANQIDNCTNSASTSGGYFNIYNNVVSSAALSISNNIFSSNSSTASTGNIQLIYNASATSNTILINNNASNNCAHTISSTGAYFGIFNNGASTANLEMKQNTFLNHRINAFSGLTYLIYNTGAIANSIVMSNNLVSGCTNSITSAGSFYGIYNNAASSASIDMSGNTFSANIASATSGSVHLIYNRGAATNTFVNASLNNNLVTSCSFIASSGGPFLGIYNSGVACTNLSLSNNTLTTNSWTTATSLKYMIYNTGAVSSVLNINANTLANFTITNNTTGTFNGINNAGTCTVGLSISNNTFSNIINSSTSGGTYLMLNSGALSGGTISVANNAVSGFTNTISGLGDFYGISNTGTTFSGVSIINNVYTNNFITSSTGVIGLIYNTGAAATTINTIDLSNNTVANSTSSVTSSGSFFGIYNNGSSCMNLTLNANTFTNNAAYAATGSNHLIYNRGALTNTFSTITIGNNLISNCTHGATGAANFYSIWNNGVTSTITSITNNSIVTSVWTSTTALRYLISNFGPAITSENISGNLISNCTHTNNTTGSLYCIYNNNTTAVSSGILTINNNTITANISTATTGETHMVDNTSAITNTFTSISLTNNLLSNCSSTVNGSGPFYGFYNNTASAADINLSQNTFTSSALTSSTGSTFFIYNRGLAGNLFSSVTASNNVLSSITHSNNSNGTFFGIVNAGAATTTCALLTIRSNSFINTISSGTSGNITLVNNSCPVTTSIAIATNSFVNLTNTITTTGTFYGINNGGNSSLGDLSIDANSFVNLVSTASSANRLLIYNNGGITNSLSLTNNLISNCSHSITSTGSFYGIYNNSAASGLSANLSNNTFTNNFSSSLGGSTNLILNAGLVSTTLTNISMNNNLVDSYTNVATTGAFYGVYNSVFTSTNLSMLTNTVSNITGLSVNGAQQPFYNTGKVINAISINGNLISAYTNTVNTGGAFYGISTIANYTGSTLPLTLDVSNNRIVNTSLNATTGSLYMINASGAASNTIGVITINGNTCSGLSNTISSSGSFFGINNSAISAGNLSINNNSLTSIAVNSTLSARYMIYNSGIILNTADLSNNLLTNFSSTLNTTGAFFGINNSGNIPGNLNVANNIFQNHQLSVSTAVSQMIYNSGTVTNSINIANNLLSNITQAATSGSLYGVFNNAGSSTNLNITANTFTNVSDYSTSGALYLIYNNRVPAAATINAISITNNNSGAVTFSSQSGAFCGIFNNNTSFANLGVSNNTLSNVAATTTTGSRYFVYTTGVGSTLASITNNLISDFTSTLNTTGAYYGIVNGGNQLGDLTMSGNRFINHTLSASTGSAFIVYNTGAVSNALTMDNNLVSNFTHNASAQGVFSGIYNNVPGSMTVSPTASLSISGNTLATTNFSTTSGAIQYFYNRGVTSNSFTAISILNNVVSNASFSATSGPFYGVYNSSTSFTNLAISGNSFNNIASSTTTSPRYFFFNSGVSYSITGITTNTVTNYSAVLNTSGVFYNAVNTGSVNGNLDISGNMFSAESLTSTTGTSYMINNAALVSGTTSITNNLISAISHTSSTGILYGVLQNAVSGFNLSVNGNTLMTISTTNSTSTKYLIYNTTSVTAAIHLNNNVVTGYSAPFNTTGNFGAIYNTGHSQGSFEALNNTINNVNLPATTGTCYAIFTNGTVTSSSSINNNLISNLNYTSSTSGTFYGIYNLASSSASLSMSGNTFSSSAVSVPTAAVYMIYGLGTSTINVVNVNLDNNTVKGFTNTLGSGTFYGIYNNGVSSSSLSMSGNTYTNCVSSTSTSSAYLIYNTGSVVATMNFNSNQIGNQKNILNTTGSFYGIYNSALCNGGLNMNTNSVAGNFLESTTGLTYLIYNAGNATNGMSMSSNTVANTTNSTATSTGDFFAIYNSGATNGNLDMSINTVTGNASSAASANTYLIYNSGAVSNSITLGSNKLGQSFTNNSIDYSGTLYNIYNTGGTNTTTLAISSNTFTGYNYTGIPGSGNIYYIHNTNNNARYDITSNLWSSISLNHNGSEYLMYNPSSTGSQLNVLNNTASGYTRTANAAALYFYYSNGNSPSSCIQVFSGNTFSNITAGNQGTGSFYGIYTMDGTGTTYPKKFAFNNTITNVTYNGLGFFYGYYFDFLGDASSTGSDIYNNTLSNVSWGGPLYALYIGGNVSSGFFASVHSNTIINLSSSGTTADVYGSYLLGGGNGLVFYKNKIGNLSSNGTLGKAEGLRVNSATNTTAYDNLIGNVFTPSSSVVNGLNGINVAGGSDVKLFYNTVYLNAVSTGTLFGSNALFANSTVSLNLRNNIFINNTTPNGTGLATAYLRSSSNLPTYLSTSDNNIFYAGIPSTTHLIYSDGTTNCQTLPAYQATVSPRDNASASENTPFLSTVATNTSFLHVDFTIPSVTESGAANISGITDDVDFDIRQGNGGYVGTGSAPDIGADEYAQNLTPCSGASAGTISVPSSTVRCEGETVYLLSTGYTAAGDITHQWKISSNSGGPYTNVTAGIGATTTAYTSPTLSAGTYYYILVTTCSNGNITGTSNEATVVVNAGPTASASVSSPTICAGADLSFTGTSNIGINYSWIGPNNFTSTAQNPTITNVVTNASGTYTLLVSDANCTSYPVYVNVNIHATPPSFTLTPPASSICIGGSQTITASIPINSPTLNFGSQTNQNTASGYPAPYSVYYGGQKMQMLILATELAAAGFTIGTPIQSVQFPVVSLGTNWNTSLFSCQNFMIGMKATTSTALNVFETGISNVVPSTNYTPGVGYNNVHTFSAPFIWDGISNLILETVFSNSITGTSGNTVKQYNSPTGFQSTLVYRVDNQNVLTVAAATTSNINIGFVRPDFKLNGTQVGTYSWSPSNGLSSTTGVSVVTSPTATSIYTVELSDGQCASSTSISIEIIQNPTLSISTSASTVCLGNTATLTASGANQYTWSTNSTQTNIVVSPFVSTTYTLTGENPACPPTSTTILVYSAPALTLSTLASPPVICQGATSTLNVSGASNYTWTGGSNATSIPVTPSVTANYTVNAYDGPGCWTTKVVNVKVNPLPVITVTPSGAEICFGESVTFEAGGVFNFTWSPIASNSPIFNITPTVSTSYTVLGVDQNNCPNTAVVTVTVDACTAVTNIKGVRSILVYPNPSSGGVVIDFGFAGEKSIRVEDALGSLILKKTVVTEQEKIDLGSYAKGFYFIKVQSEKQTANYKVVIE